MRSRQSKKGSQYNSLKKKDKSLKGQTMIYKSQHIKTKDITPLVSSLFLISFQNETRIQHSHIVTYETRL
jgi:hypothetical protein